MFQALPRDTLDALRHRPVVVLLHGASLNSLADLAGAEGLDRAVYMAMNNKRLSDHVTAAAGVEPRVWWLTADLPYQWDRVMAWLREDRRNIVVTLIESVATAQNLLLRDEDLVIEHMDQIHLADHAHFDVLTRGIATGNVTSATDVLAWLLTLDVDGPVYLFGLDGSPSPQHDALSHYAREMSEPEKDRYRGAANQELWAITQVFSANWPHIERSYAIQNGRLPAIRIVNPASHFQNLVKIGLGEFRAAMAAAPARPAPVSRADAPPSDLGRRQRLYAQMQQAAYVAMQHAVTRRTVTDALMRGMAAYFQQFRQPAG